MIGLEEARRAKTGFRRLAAEVRVHYAGCTLCRESTGCSGGRALWDQLARAHVEVVRTCVQWHAVRFRGESRAQVLVNKMVKTADLFSRAERVK